MFFCLFAKGLGLYFIVHLVSEVRREFLFLFLSRALSASSPSLSGRSLNFAFVSSNLFHCLLDVKTLNIWGVYCFITLINLLAAVYQLSAFNPLFKRCLLPVHDALPRTVYETPQQFTCINE